MPLPHRALGSALGAVLGVALLVSCSGDDTTDRSAGNGPSAGSVDPPPPLTEVWRSRPPQGSTLSTSTRVTPTHLVLVESKVLRGYDLTDGAEAWTMKPPKGLGRFCLVSPQVNQDGVAGVLMGGRGRDCTVAAALDTADGSLLWRRTMPSAPPYHSGHGVSVGDDALTAEMFCDEVRRFDLSDGAPLRTLAPRDRKCGMESASNGQLIAVLNDPETAATPDDRGTGLIPPHASVGALELYDADTAKLLWRHEVQTKGASADAVVSDDPVVLTRTLRGHRLTQIYGASGKPGPYLGKALVEFGPQRLEPIGRVGDTLVATYTDADEGLAGGDLNATSIFGYDLTTGEELWHRALDQPSGVWVHDGSLLTATPVQVPGDEGRTWLQRTSAADPSQIETLGSLPQESRVLAVADGVVIASEEEGLVAYEIPDSGGAYDAPPSPTEPAWAEDDIRPETVAFACEAVRPSTLRLLGFQSPRLPPPADCGYDERYQPDYVDRSLRVTVTAHAPSADATAVEAAEQATSDGPEHLTASLGDEAWFGSSDGIDGRRTWVTVRWRNVVVSVDARQEALLEDRWAYQVPEAQLEDAAFAAAADVLRTIGASVEAPERGRDGRFRDVPDVCRLLADDAAALAPGAAATDVTPVAQPERREAGCHWGGADYQPELLAQVYAVPGSTADRQRATKQAAEIFSSRASGAGVGSLGDEAARDVFSFERGRSLDVTLRVRKDNLIVVVSYDKWDHPSRAEMESQVEGLALKLLSAATN